MKALPTLPPSLPFLPTTPLTHSKWGDFLGLPLMEDNLQIEMHSHILKLFEFGMQHILTLTFCAGTHHLFGV